MKDKASNFPLNELKVPTMHGHTRIELKNVKTGLKEVVESENTFQSGALANFLRTYGYARGSKYTNNSSFTGRDTWKNLVGGLFLFKNGINVGTEYMPAGNQMVGCGVEETTNGGSATDPNEMGSWNATESSATASAITQVYDFTTDQANGTIGCVCLTSRMGGLIGYGNASKKVKGLYNLSGEQPIFNNIWRSQMPYNGKYYLSAIVSNGILSITKCRRNLFTGSVFEGFSKTETFDLSEVGNPYNVTDTYSLYLQEYTAGKVRFVLNYSGGTNVSIQPSGTAYYYEYDIENNTLQLKSFVNSSQHTFYWNGASQPIDRWYVCFRGDYIFVILSSSNYHLLIFNANTSELLADIAGAPYNFTYGGITIGDLGNGLYVIPLSYRQNYDAEFPSGSGSVVWDSVANTIKIINLSYNNICTYIPSMNCLYGVGNDNTSIFSHPLYLATINNIQPVTKTAAQTMKVTYTLTEV